MKEAILIIPSSIGNTVGTAIRRRGTDPGLALRSQSVFEEANQPVNSRNLSTTGERGCVCVSTVENRERAACSLRHKDGIRRYLPNWPTEVLLGCRWYLGT